MQASPLTTLPAADADSSAHSARCVEFIREQMRAAGGSLGFAEYMQHALYAPGLGYYAAGATKFGAAGDFVTAPEVSPVFGCIVARQCAAVLAEMEDASILEFGAGSGRLAVDVLRKLDALRVLPAGYLILEVSPDLEERQRRLLQEEIPELSARVSWTNKMPAAHRGVVIANEVLDALPVERFVRRDNILQQRVAWDDASASFCFVEADAGERLNSAVAGIEKALGTPLPRGFTSEVSLAASGWVADMLASLDDGVVFLFDYGLSRGEYYAPDRDTGWLRCHFRHHAHNNPLLLAGIQDITAWVDFTASAEAAVDAGADIAGYTNQASFLIGGGLADELETMSSLPLEQQVELSTGVKMLTLPGEMGEHFKCLGLSKGRHAPLPAFQLADRTHTL